MLGMAAILDMAVGLRAIIQPEELDDSTLA
jgi:hypothetical protein